MFPMRFRGIRLGGGSSNTNNSSSSHDNMNYPRGDSISHNHVDGIGDDGRRSRHSNSSKKQMKQTLMGNHEGPFAKGISSFDKSLQGQGALYQFDACVEACDALAASGGHTIHSNGIMTQGAYALNDCSIMVSPDGNLLFLPRGDETAGSLRSGSDTPHKSFNNKKQNATLSSGSDWVPSTPTTPVTSTTLTGNEIPDTPVSEHHSQFFAGEDYGSAIVVGNDLTIGGDHTANGFSAKGWNPDRATKAIEAAQSALQSTLTLVEDLACSQKNHAATTSQACDRIRDSIVFEESPEHQAVYAAQRNILSSPRRRSHQPFLSSDEEQCHSHDNSNVANALLEKASQAMESFHSSISPEQKSRSGPLQFPGSTLHAAAVAMEQYHSLIAEGDAYRWRMASSRNPKKKSHGLLPQLHDAIHNLSERAKRRTSAFQEMRNRTNFAERTLLDRKRKAQDLWKRIKHLEDEVQTQMEERVRERSRAREEKRRKDQNERQALVAAGKLESTVTQQEIWELISQVSKDMDSMSFAPTGLPTPSAVGPLDQTMDIPNHCPASPNHKYNTSSTLHPPSPGMERDQIEHELGLHSLRQQAWAADEDVDDAACALLNILSAFDTTKRSARIAAESCLLSAANSNAECLRSMLELEKDSIKERLKYIQNLEAKINEIDVRADLQQFIDHEKRNIVSGGTRLGDDDDGGIASALAVLNSHSEGVGIGVSVLSTSSYSGWESSDNNVIHRDDIEEAIETLFQSNPLLLEENSNETKGDKSNQSKREEDLKVVEEAIQLLKKAVSEKNGIGRSHRASVCYALNNQRGLKTHIDSTIQFDGLCNVLDTLLTSCDREAADIASAKMCMMLSQTFYMIEDAEENCDDREKRIYPKIKLVNHSIWSDEDFWVQALFQCVTESLTQSGVMSGFEKEIFGDSNGKVQTRKIKWYDLTSEERSEAASQVHAVIFAQLGALAHSMVEFGCNLETACAFVRRLSIRHQLPLSHRSMLLQHLIDRNSIVNGNDASNPSLMENSKGIVKMETENSETPDANSTTANKIPENENAESPTSPPHTGVHRKVLNDKGVNQNEFLDLVIPFLADEEERDDNPDLSDDSKLVISPNKKAENIVLLSTA